MKRLALFMSSLFVGLGLVGRRGGSTMSTAESS